MLRSQAILGPFAQKHHKEATSLKKEGDSADVEEAGEASKSVCTSKVSEPKLVSESVEVDRFRLAILGCIRSFVIKERRTWKVGSEGGQVNLKSTGVTVTLPEDAVSEETNISVTSYLPEDYTETPAITCVTTVLPHGLTLRKKAAIELRHHLCLETPFRVRILYHSGLPKCDEGYQLLADLNQETRSAIVRGKEFRVERNCIRIFCLGFSGHCVVTEGHFCISLRIYAPLSFTEGETGSVVASLSCQCDEVAKKIAKDQRELAVEPRQYIDYVNDCIKLESTDEVELSVDTTNDSSALYSVRGKSSYTISAIALKSMIGEGHINYITRSFLLRWTNDSSKRVGLNFSYNKTGSTEDSIPLYAVIWKPMPRPENSTPLFNGSSEAHNGTIQRQLQDHFSDKAVNAAANQFAGDWLEEVVSPEERLSVAKRIGHHWQHVGETLGPDPKFTTIDLDDFKAKGSDRDRAQTMLNTWAEKHHKNATRRMLILALKEENQNALISKVFERNPDRVTAQPPPPLHYSEGTGKAMLFL